MITKGFSEEEVNKYVEFLNYIATHAKFDQRTVKNQIEFVKLLQYQQTVLLKRMQDLIVGEPKLHTPAKKTKTKAKTTARKA